MGVEGGGREEGKGIGWGEVCAQWSGMTREAVKPGVTAGGLASHSSGKIS